MQKANLSSRGLPRAKSRGFTLLELIIVIAILAILSVAVVLVINPAETLARARDSQRLSDLSAVKSAIGLYLAEQPGATLDGGAGGTCTANVFISSAVAIAAGTVCTQGFATVANSASGAVDGSGWIPADLTGFIDAAAAPLLNPAISNFPIDPVNDESAGTSDPAVDLTEEALIYLYRCDSTALTFELNASMESARYRSGGPSDKETGDGGNNNLLYEVGTDGGLDLCSTW